jgi:hypothetical protein
MTTWIPTSDPSHVISKTDNTRAIATGLTFRPLAATSVDAVAWVLAQPADERERLIRAAGLHPAKERKVLAAWRERG